MQNSALPGEVVMEYLHDELVNYATRKGKKDQLDKPRVMADLENSGFEIGSKIIKRLDKTIPWYVSELDTVIFIYTEFWNTLFNKKADWLQTIDPGVYEIGDDSFRFLNKISNDLQQLESAPMYLAYTAGIIRGALAYLGIDSTVTGEVDTIPGCKFKIYCSNSN